MGKKRGWFRHIITHHEVKRAGLGLLRFFEKSIVTILSMILLATLLLAYMPRTLFEGVLGNPFIGAIVGSLIGMLGIGTPAGAIILVGEVAPVGLTTAAVVGFLLGWNGLLALKRKGTLKERIPVVAVSLLFSVIVALVLHAIFQVMGW